jgi:hypothetical protein
MESDHAIGMTSLAVAADQHLLPERGRLRS